MRRLSKHRNNHTDQGSKRHDGVGGVRILRDPGLLCLGNRDFGAPIDRDIADIVAAIDEGGVPQGVAFDADGNPTVDGRAAARGGGGKTMWPIIKPGATQHLSGLACVFRRRGP